MYTPDNENLHELLFAIRRSARYHNRRRNFFDSFSKIMDIITTLAGSAAVISILSHMHYVYPTVFAGLAAFCSCMSIALHPVEMSHIHHDLAKRYIGLEKEIISKNSYSEEDFKQFMLERLNIEADEPPVMRTLDIICHNELMLAMGYSDNFIKIPWYKRIPCQYIR